MSTMRIGPALVSTVAMVALTACGSNNELSASQVSTNEAEASVAAPVPDLQAFRFGPAPARIVPGPRRGDLPGVADLVLNVY